MKLGWNLGDESGIADIQNGNRTFAGDESHRVHFDFGAAPGGPSHIPLFRPASAPVADVSLSTDEHDIERRDADIEYPQEFARGGIQLQQTVGEIAADVKFAAIRGKGQTGW